MFSNLKHTFKQTAIYSLSNISSKLIGIILLPIYTNPDYLSIKEYGIWTTLEVTSQIIIGVLALNLPLAMLRFSSSEKDVEKIKSIVFTTMIALVFIIIISCMFFLSNVTFFSRVIFGNNSYSDYFTLLFIYSAFGIYNGVPLNILRINEKSVKYIFITSIKFAIILLFNIYFVVYENSGVIGVIKGQLYGEIFLTIITLPFVLNNIIPRIDFVVLKEMLRYGSPLIFSSLASFIFAFGDRYVLLHYLGAAKVGIYSMGYKIASVINMLILQSFQLGFPPIAYKKLGDKDSNIFYAKVLTYYVIILVFFALILSLFGKEIIEIFSRNAKYSAAYGVIPIISLAFVIKGIQYNFALSFHYEKKTVYNAIIVIIAACISLLINIIFVPLFELNGAAYTMLLSITIMMLLSYFGSRKVFPISFEISKIVKIIITGILLFVISGFTNNFFIINRVILKLVIILLYFPTLLVVGIFDKSEIEKLKAFVQRER